ncbi:MAG: hypothetical protein ACRDRO_27815 [Pseudonocardiaceae bacterium]
MSLAPLATRLDLSKAGVTLAPGEQDLVDQYLAVSAATIREAAGVPISQTTSTVDIEGTVHQWLRPPGVPVTAVASASIDGVAVTDYVLRSGQLWRALGWSDWLTPSLVELVYTHGLSTVPADIVDLNCRMAMTALVVWRAAADGSGLVTTGVERQETLGDYSVTYGSTGVITEMMLPSQIREQLAARFGGGVSLVGSR